MTNDTIVTCHEDAIDFSRPVDGTWRGAVGTLSGALLSAAVAIVVLARPSFDLFPDAFVWFGCGLGIALGSAGVSAALSGIDRVVSFRARGATVFEELRPRYGAVLRRRRVGGRGGALGALREDLAEGGSLWHLVLLDGKDGAAIEIGEFCSEEAMRCGVAELVALRPDIAVG